MLQESLESSDEETQLSLLKYVIDNSLFVKLERLTQNNVQLIEKFFDDFSFTSEKARAVLRLSAEVEDKRAVGKLAYRFATAGYREGGPYKLLVQDRIDFLLAAKNNLLDLDAQKLQKINKELKNLDF